MPICGISEGDRESDLASGFPASTARSVKTAEAEGSAVGRHTCSYATAWIHFCCNPCLAHRATSAASRCHGSQVKPLPPVLLRCSRCCCAICFISVRELPDVPTSSHVNAAPALTSELQPRLLTGSIDHNVRTLQLTNGARRYVTIDGG